LALVIPSLAITLGIVEQHRRRRAEALLKKEQQLLREGQQAMAGYQAELCAMREKTARLRALRLARDLARKTLPAQKQSAY
jgi:hypothetical protein